MKYTFSHVRRAPLVKRLTCLAGILLLSSAAADSFHPILTNGPSESRIDVVFLAEGYTAAQSQKFLTDVTNSANALLAQQPCAAYRTFFNVSAIFVPSTQSGSDHPSYGSFRNTYFNSTYDELMDFIITIPNGSTGLGEVKALLDTYAPGAELPILLVNDLTSGGSDGFGSLVVASSAAGARDIIAHEAGHVLAGLGDEYYDIPLPGYLDTEEPNTTRETRRDFIKWRAWIDSATPVPTPESNPQYLNSVGLFEGAHYHETGWFRPKYDCKMNHNAVAFCEVCREALVISFYERAKAVSGFSPGTTNLVLSAPQDVLFSVSLVRPVPDTLSVQWVTNGVVVAGATNDMFRLAANAVTVAPLQVTVAVQDATPFVRTDPNHRLSSSVAWQVSLAGPQLTLREPQLLPDGRFAFKVAGQATRAIVERSSSVSDWLAVQTNQLVGGFYWFTNDMVSDRSFFRAKVAP